MPPWYEVPPEGYGGLERVCASLVDGLIARGHDVTLFGAGVRTGTRARFVSTNPELQYPRLMESIPELVHITHVNELLDQEHFDIVHDHTHVGPITAPQRRAPTVTTVHGPPVGDIGTYLSRLDKTVALVAISGSQRASAPHLRWSATVHHGIETDGPTKTAPSSGPVLWLGRFNPTKGPDLAIEACRKAGLPLVLAGKCNEPLEWRYLEEVIRPILGPDVELVLNADRARTNALLEQARALILPVRWEEPFGMVLIEAMAVGTPVVALGRGAIPEVVDHGRTGFVCHDEAQLPEALTQALTLSPADCVDHIRTSFSVDLMAQRYEKVYLRAMDDRPRRHSATAPVVPAHTSPSQSRAGQSVVGPLGVSGRGLL